MMAHTPELPRPSPLASQIEAQTRDLDWTLAHYTFVANVTTLATECDIAHSPAMSVASCRSTTQPILAFLGDSADLLATYAAFLADPGQEVDLLVNESQRAIVEEAFSVLSVLPQWQMVFRGDAARLRSWRATELVENDLAAVEALAKAERASYRLYTSAPLEHGPAYGVWDRRRLVAVAMTMVCVPGAAEIGNVVARRDYRDQDVDRDVIAALVKDHAMHGRGVFTMVPQDDVDAVRLFERSGFRHERTMYLMRCLLKANPEDETAG